MFSIARASQTFERRLKLNTVNPSSVDDILTSEKNASIVYTDKRVERIKPG